MKSSYLWRLCRVVVLLALFIGPAGPAYAAPVTSLPAASHPGMRVVDAAFVGASRPLRSLAPVGVSPDAPGVLRQGRDRLAIAKPRSGQAGGGFDASIVQNSLVGSSMPSAAANFEGIDNISKILPPDTQGDVGSDPVTGKKYYVQWVNLNFQIWDVTNPAAVTSLYGPAAGNTLWAGSSGTICAANNDGDPITQFDHLANRWMMSQFALGFPDNFHQCIAVSASADPTGAWYLYDFQTSTTLMNDYPHFGVWPDGYYMSVNQFDGVTQAWAGAGAAVFERSAMLAGRPARMIYVDTGAVTHNYGGMLPSDLDGPAPAAGTPNYFMEWDDSTWLRDATDTLRIWEFKTDWAVPANSSFGLNASYDPNRKIASANVDPNLCDAATGCIPQPGTSQKLDAIADRLMYRLQYRNFGSYQTLVGNHSVDANGADHAGIHWFELRNTGAGFGMRQQGVYAPDSDQRWMGSAAMDASGDIALGYSVSSGTTYPSIRYSGRLAADPLNTLAQGEATLIAGSGSQTSTLARWGDYSMLAVDASDGCTFWYTQEYIQDTGTALWRTRVGSFKFPGCTPAPTGTLSGSVTDSASAPLAGATVAASGGYTTVSDAAGHYALTLTAGTYAVTASKYGYTSSVAPAVVVTAPGSSTQNFTLAAALSATISGVVTDAATGWPLYARLDISGFPGGPVFSNPVTGAYSAPLTNAAYTFTVSAMSGGYTPAVLPLVVSGSATRNFGLVADAQSCNAPGYQLIPGSLLSSDGFDVAAAPAFSPGWATAAVSGNEGEWVTGTASLNPAGIAPHSVPNMAVFNSYIAVTGESTRLYQTGGMDLSARSSAEVSFWMAHDPGYMTSVDTVQVQVSSDAGLTWNNAGAPVARFQDPDGWTQHTFNIDGYTGAGMTDVRIAFLGTSDYGNDIHIDDMAVSTPSTCIPMPAAGLVTGAVFDANTGLLVKNASVTDGALRAAVLIDASADPAAPAQVYVIAQPSGARTLSASAPRYTAATQSVPVAAGGTVRQDFYLAAGKLSASPTSLAFEASSAAPTAVKAMTLSNGGGAPASYEIFAVPGTFAGYAVLGPFADHTRHFGPKDLNDLNSAHIRVDLTPPHVPLIGGGAVSAAWPSGLAHPWGLGFNTDANDLWLGNTGAGGDELDYRFTTAGVKTGDTISTLPWLGTSGGDMTYNPFSHKLWQVNIGGDNCIHELDPAVKISTGNKICPAFGTSERGLAFDPLSNTYFAGSWNDGIINHFAPDGTMLASVNVGLKISGLAFNPGSGHLFVLTNGTGSPDVYVLDINTPGYDILGGFYLSDGATRVFAGGEQAGLEIDCAGSLWAVNQATRVVYAAASGESGVCSWQAAWLSAAPAAGTAAAGGSAPLAVHVDATGMARGAYAAYLRVVNSSPYGDQIVPVSLNVVNAAPVANAQTVNTAEDTSIAITLTAADSDGEPLTYSVVAPPEHGGLTGSAPNLTYTPAANYSGPDSFSFKASDGAADSSPAAVSITVSAAPRADLAISHGSVPPAVAPNATWWLRLSVANGGPAQALQLSLSDTLPAGVAFISAGGAGWTCAPAAGVVSCTRPALAAGSSTALTITLQAPAAPGMLTNQASIISAVLDPAAGNNTTSASIQVSGASETGMTYYLPLVSVH